MLHRPKVVHLLGESIICLPFAVSRPLLDHCSFAELGAISLHVDPLNEGEQGLISGRY